MTSAVTNRELATIIGLFATVLEDAARIGADDIDNPQIVGDAVLVPSAPPTITDAEHCEDNPENAARIHFGIFLCKLKMLSGDEWFDELPAKLPPDLDVDSFPLLYINAEAQQLYALLELAKRYYPAERIRAINCGNRRVGNTLTQFTTIADTPALRQAFIEHGKVTVVTSAYHVPRIYLTAKKCLEGICEFTVEPVPLVGPIQFPVTLELIKAELDRIAKYIEKGDLARP